MQQVYQPTRRTYFRPARDHPRRTFLLACLATPANFNEVIRRSGIPSGGVNFHLQVLARQGLVAHRRVGVAVIWFRPGLDATEVVAATIRTTWQPVLNLVRRQPGLFQRDILDALAGPPRSSTQHALKALVRVGLVTETQHGRWKAYKPAEVA